MPKLLAHRTAALAAMAAALALSACGKTSYSYNANTAPTQTSHFAFNIAAGPHALDCVACHSTFPSFSQFDCLGCHTRPPTDAVHTTTLLYTYENGTDTTGCKGCHFPHNVPVPRPFDHKVAFARCDDCHGPGAFYAYYAALPATHPDILGADCAGCHGTPTWTTVVAPSGLIADPITTVTVNALVPRYSGTSIVQLTPQVEILQMWMSHGTSQVNMAALACSVCHLDINQGSLYPGLLHSALANALQPNPTACLDCHTGSAPTGFVGPTATSPVRTPPSGEMKHDAVLWAGGAPTATRLVTADCGVCHLPPDASLAATWATWTNGTLGTNALPQYHSSLSAAVPSLPQPASCLDCHANSRPAAVLSSVAAALSPGLTFDHADAIAVGDCRGCHAGSTSAWSGGRYHLVGSTNPASCLPCHDGQRPSPTINPVSGWNSLSYAGSPFDYVTNVAGITHGDGQDCALCHGGPGFRGSTPGAWGVSQTFEGGHFTHGPATVSGTTCIACHMSQRPDLVLSAPALTAWLNAGGFDHASGGTGDCIGCHRATVTAGTYVNYYAAGGAFPGGDWKGGKTYPGAELVSAPNQFVTVTEISLVRPSAGALVTGMTAVQETLYNAMLHTSSAIPSAVAPGTLPNGDPASCWHCHTHSGTSVTSYAGGVFHAALTGYAATPGGTLTALPQPTGQCSDCHAQMRPIGIVEKAGSSLVPMDHAAAFTATVTIAGQSVSSVAGLDCSACHKQPGTTWGDGTFHAKIGSAVPADCVACHYPLMADGPKANVTSGTDYAMAHGSTRLTFQACATCHTTALSWNTALAPAATLWRTGAYHGSVPSQPTGCLDCHAVSEPAANHPTASSWVYALTPPSAVTSSNTNQWMNHGAAPVAGADCSRCHQADARASGSAWSRSTEFHVAVTSPGTCQVCHGLQNGGGAVIGTSNNLPVGLTSSTMLTTASANALTGVPAGTRDQISHGDVNVSGHDCGFCHTQAGRLAGGGEWARASFHTSFTSSAPLLINGSTGRCSNCHLNVKPGTSYTAQDHSGFTATSTQDCNSCHSWPGTGNNTAPNWKGASGTPLYINVGGFTIPAPPATTPVTQAGIASLPHPTVTAPTTCASCHTGGAGGKNAKGYDHKSALANTKCSACHEAGTNLLGTPWNGATAQASGAGDSRPYTLTAVAAHRGTDTGTCNITVPKHFYPVDCGQCHAVPAGNGLVTTGPAYVTAWLFPHTQSKMTNPGTCNLCHVGQGCSK